MGAPVAGSNVRATVLTGGGLRLKGLRPRLRSRRMQMIFPLSGSERRGLVSLEAKKLKVRPPDSTTSLSAVAEVGACQQGHCVPSCIEALSCVVSPPSRVANLPESGSTF